jgi:hypothetical protein
MRPNTRSILAALLAVAATAAVAQTTPNAGATPQQPKGFFSTQSQSDPSLFRTLPPEAYEATPNGQAAPSQPAATANADANRPLVVVVPQAANTEGQVDRAQIEAQQAQVNRAPAPINGAFTGNTDPNNR